MTENTPEPTFTQTPNILYDVIQRRIDPHEFSIMSVVVRKTYGFHKTHDAISNSQIEAQTGFTRPTVTKYAEKLERRRLLTIVKAPGKTPLYLFGPRFKRISDAYMLRIIRKKEQEPGNDVAGSPGNNVSTPRKHRFPPPRNGVSPQKKVLNKDLKENHGAALRRRLTDTCGEAHKYLTGSKLEWVGHEKAYGEAMNKIAKLLEGADLANDDARHQYFRKKCAAYVQAAQKDEFLKKHGCTPLSLLNNWNKVHFNKASGSGSFSAVEPSAFPPYLKMSAEEIRQNFTEWQSKWTPLVVKANIRPDAWREFVDVHRQYAPKLVEVLIRDMEGKIENHKRSA